MVPSFPLWLKIVYALLAAVMVPTWTVYHGPTQFLWFSNLGFVLTGVALWQENRLLTGMMAIGTVLPELAWNVSFWGLLLFGVDLVGLAGYVFEDEDPFLVRAISVAYHAPLPFLLLWMVHRAGYDTRAFLPQCFLGWAALIASFLLTSPDRNVNWVYANHRVDFIEMPDWAWLALMLVAFPLLIYWPTHAALKRWRGDRRPVPPASS